MLFYETRLTNATVVNDAMRFVSDYSKNNNLMSKEEEVYQIKRTRPQY
jgi:hypothetical protein